MTYNLSAISSNTTGIASLAQGVNDELMFGWFGVILLVSITTIIYMGLQSTTGDASKAFPATAFICSGIAILLRLLNLLPDLALFITFVLCAGTIALSVAKK